MPLPNFIVIGVAKAATTSVHAYADQHSEIFMSPVKETNYFALYGKPPDSAGPGDNTIRNRQSVFRRPDYEALFEGRTTQRILGEASPGYMTVSEVPSRIAATSQGADSSSASVSPSTERSPPGRGLE